MHQVSDRGAYTTSSEPLRQIGLYLHYGIGLLPRFRSGNADQFEHFRYVRHVFVAQFHG